MRPPFLFEHSVEVAAPARVAWEFWTNVENWKLDPSVEWVRLDGDFREGAVGETKPHGRGPDRWRVAESSPPARAVIEMKLGAATARFEMSFEPLSENSSRLRQRMTLEGPGSEMFAAGLHPESADGFRAGMRKLADAIEEYAAGREP